jgi:alkylhydroperoxidase family enzyme
VKYGRARWLRRGDCDADQRRVFDRVLAERVDDEHSAPIVDADGRMLGPFTAMLVHPSVADASQALGAAIRFHGRLEPRAREIAILTVASWCRSAFEWSQHARLAGVLGLAGDELAALSALLPSPAFSAAERLVQRAVLTLLERDDLDDELFAELQGPFGDAGVVELIAIVGHYQMLARSLRVWRTPLPDGDPHPIWGDGHQNGDARSNLRADDLANTANTER